MVEERDAVIASERIELRAPAFAGAAAPRMRRTCERSLWSLSPLASAAVASTW
jgi:hypothetical protein